MPPLESIPALSPRNRPARKHIAVVGTGIAGLSAAWLLSKHHDVTIYEANDYIGGHSNTVDITVGDQTFPVDTGFIVFNPQNYPNLTALFEHLEVPTTATDMSFSVSLDDGAFEYSGGDGNGLLAQKSNLLRPRFWSMVRGILRFYRKAETYCNDSEINGLTLGALLAREGYSKAFIDDHLAPMGAAIWSSNSTDILDYPASSFLRFFMNHGLVQLNDRPQWRTVTGGSREYVKRLTESLSHRIRLSTPVLSVEETGTSASLTAKGEPPANFDDVVFACHSDQALRLIKTPTNSQTDALRDLRYSKNTVALHTDMNLMPKRRAAWASWNYVERRGGANRPGPAVSYWMNRLQPLPTDEPVIVTLNPDRDIDSSKVLGTFDYEHPIFDQAALAAKAKVWSLQGASRMWYAGAYLGDGFHEDGIQAGLAVAEMLGGTRRPWFRPGQNARIGFDDLLDQRTEVYQ